MTIKTLTDLTTLCNSSVLASDVEAGRLARLLGTDPLRAMAAADTTRIVFARANIAKRLLADARTFVPRVGEADFLNGAFTLALQGATHPGTDPSEMALRAAWGELLRAFGAVRPRE